MVFPSNSVLDFILLKRRLKIDWKVILNIEKYMITIED